MISDRYLLNLSIAIEAIQANKFRSFLTALGIIFGVAAVIAMLAIGKGAKQEILDQIKLIGVDNIVITPLIEQTEGEVGDETSASKNMKKYSPGLTLEDARSIIEIIPSINMVSPETIIETDIMRSGYKRSGKLIGIELSFFELSNIGISKGKMFNEYQLKFGSQVCIIGSGIKVKFFSQTEPIGKYIKCGPIWLKVVGILEEKSISKKAISNLGIRDYNMDVYTPIKTILMRYKNRAKVTEKMIRARRNDDGNNVNENYHQLDRLVVRVSETRFLESTAEIVRNMLERRHYKVIDYEIKIPKMLLKQQQRTKDIFNIVLGSIASISLLIGGIGIMNIMLASVLERIKEIGIRLSIGARKEDVVLQFVIEAILISLTGGLVGIIIGISIAIGISEFFDIKTLISWPSVIISFCVAAFVGLVFGIAPAKKAADQDPVVSLRHE